MRAYSIASPNWEEHLEFFSIKVPDGPLTSQLQHLKEGDEIIISKKPTGTLVLDDLNPQDLYSAQHRHRPGAVHERHPGPETYERFEKVILATACVTSTKSPTASSSPSTCRRTSSSASGA
jgi:ferredoxin--NADP+ reductase